MRVDGTVIISVIVAVVITTGMLISYTPGLYGYDVDFRQSGDEITVSYHSNVNVRTNTVVIANTGLYRVENVIAYLDPDYATMNDWDELNEFMHDLRIQLVARGISSFSVMNSEEIMQSMETEDPGSVAVVIATGSISSLLYDGTENSPLIQWLERGGVVINLFGCLGKYVSYGGEKEDIVETEGYGMMFAGADDGCFNDLDDATYADAGCNEEVRDCLHFYMDECTYGIDISGMPDAVSIGYDSVDGFSSAVLFKSHNGMVMNFGISLATHEHTDYHVAQIIASGLDYDSQIVFHFVGDIGEDIVITVGGKCSVYAYMGDTRALYGERFDVRYRYNSDI